MGKPFAKQVEIRFNCDVVKRSVKITKHIIGVEVGGRLVNETPNMIRKKQPAQTPVTVE